MDESATKKRDDAPCREYLSWQGFVDDQIGVDEAELLLHHLAGCSACAEKIRTLKRFKSFCEDQLGSEDEKEEEQSRAALERTRQRIDAQRSALKPVRPARRWWRYQAIAAVIVLGLLALLYLPSIWRSVGVSAESVLEEATLRERAKLYQPGKILRWVTESDYQGLPGYPDGRYRIVHWQCNCDGSLALMTKRYDQSQQMIEAFWHQPDGTEVRFNRAAGDLVEITPGDDELRAALPALDGPRRQAVETYLARRTNAGRQHLRTQNYTDWLRRALTPSDPRSYVKVVETDELGRVYQLHIEHDYKPSTGTFVRVVSEQEIAAGTYQRLRVKNTRYRADGTSSTDDTHYTEMSEVTREDFGANDLTTLMKTAKKLVRLSPEEVARREMAEERKQY
jgi:hypothetical protein